MRSKDVEFVVHVRRPFAITLTLASAISGGFLLGMSGGLALFLLAAAVR